MIETLNQVQESINNNTNEYILIIDILNKYSQVEKLYLK